MNDVSLCGAFLLGVRASLAATDQVFSLENYVKSLEKLDAVANGEETCHDPVADTMVYGEDGKELSEAMQGIMRSDPGLAKRIVEGFRIIRRAR